MIDRFYTPDEVAHAVAEHVPRTASGCVDVACGRGALLLAAEDRSPGIRCIGLDTDRSAVRHVQRMRPGWTVSTGDLTNLRSFARTAAWSQLGDAEILLLNPPFSMGASGGRPCSLIPGSPRTSKAMCFLVTAISHIGPSLAVALVPDSLSVSDLDREARAYLSKEWHVRLGASFDHKQFDGAAARTSLLFMSRRNRRARGGARWVASQRRLFGSGITLMRGNVPVHKTKVGRAMPFVHSSDLIALAHGAVPRKRSFEVATPRRLTGSCVLVPRVGAPSREHVVVYSRETAIVLSDCVIGLRVRNKCLAYNLRDHIISHWPSFRGLYRGTGAPYTTVERLSTWIGASVYTARAVPPEHSASAGEATRNRSCRAR